MMYVRPTRTAPCLVALLALASSTLAQAPAPAAKPADAKPADTKPADTKQPAASAPAENLPDAKALHEKYLQAVGGRAALEKTTTRVIKGKLDIPAAGASGTMTMVTKAPNSAKVTQELKGLSKSERGTNGTIAWEVSDAGPRLIEGDELAEFLRTADTQNELNIEKHYAVKTVAKEQVNGSDAFKVEMTATKDKAVVHQFYDAKSGLLVKRTEKAKSPMGEVDVATTFEDYTKYGDVHVPKTTRQKVMNFEVVITVTEAQFPDTLPADTFDPPAEIKELLAAKKDEKPKDAKPGDAPAAAPAEKPAPKP